MVIYNDSNKEYGLPGSKKKDGTVEVITLGPKKSLEVSDELGKKLLGIKSYRGLKNADDMSPNKPHRLQKRIDALEKRNKELELEIKELKSEEETEDQKLGKMTIAELEDLAEKKGIDLGDAKKKQEIINKIKGA